MRQALAMRALVLCADPGSTGSDSESALSILQDLGCRVVACRFDLADLDLESITQHPPTIVVVDAGDHAGMASRAHPLLSACLPLVHIPTLLVTTLARLPVIHFTQGFDDFVLTPIVPAELYARMRLLDWKAAAFGSDEIVKLGVLVINVAAHEVYVGARKVEFTHQEFELLRFLAQNRGRVYSREQLLQQVWGSDYNGGPRTVDIHVRRVRAKLGGASVGASMAGLIVTVRGVGYKVD